MRFTFSLRFHRSLLVTFIILVGPTFLAAQSHIPDTVKQEHIDSTKMKKGAEPVSAQYDFADLYRSVVHPGRVLDPNRKISGVTIIPNIAANPTIGFQLGIKAVAGRKLGTDPRTLLSVAATSASITTKGIIYFYINHNVYTAGNKWNLQGSIIVSKSVTPDFGLGIGNNSGTTEEDRVLTNPERKGRVVTSRYYNFREKIYKELYKNLFVGAGVSFEIRRKLDDSRSPADQLTPYRVYNTRYGFNPNSYSANGFLANVQYTTRDNQNRAYTGFYVDAGFRLNQQWLGSSKSSLQFAFDVRKYVSLSDVNPEHVIAFWNWGSSLISGELPYFEIPGNGKDPGSRSGRGYTVAYFKGTQYDYSEVEYRFPITRNKFLSGVLFASAQTANDDSGTKIFQKFQPGGGGGLRVLFNKHTRTNLCLDYAFGAYGSKGFFSWAE